MYWSASACAIGRTVVDPLILSVCFCPVETAAPVFTVVAWTEGALAGEAAIAVVSAVGVGTAAWDVAAFVDPLLVHPAAMARMKTATMLREMR